MDVEASHSAQSERGPQVRCSYPVRARLRDGTDILIRPITPEDAGREQDFVRSLSPDSRYFRFLNTVRELSPDMLYRFTHPDPQRELALGIDRHRRGEFHRRSSGAAPRGTRVRPP